jgi:hypothetical protein
MTLSKKAPSAMVARSLYACLFLSSLMGSSFAASASDPLLPEEETLGMMVASYRSVEPAAATEASVGKLTAPLPAPTAPSSSKFVGGLINGLFAVGLPTAAHKAPLKWLPCIGSLHQRIARYLLDPRHADLLTQGGVRNAAYEHYVLDPAADLAPEALWKTFRLWQAAERHGQKEEIFAAHPWLTRFARRLSKDYVHSAPDAPLYVVASNADVTAYGERIQSLSVLPSTLALDLGEGTTLEGDDLFCNAFAAANKTLLLGENLKEVNVPILSDCSGFTTLDLRPLSKLTLVGNAFLADCSGLTTLDLRPLSKLISVGNAFFYGCSGLTTLDFRPLSNLTSVGDAFLHACSGLTTLDLTPLSRLTSAGYFFLSDCSGLKRLDLQPLANLTAVGHGFLSGCSGLTTLTMPNILGVVDSSGFFYNCTRLKSVTVHLKEGETAVGISLGTALKSAGFESSTSSGRVVTYTRL